MENFDAIARQRSNKYVAGQRPTETKAHWPIPPEDWYTNRKYRKQKRKDYQFFVKSHKRAAARAEAQARQAQVKAIVDELTSGDTE